LRDKTYLRHLVNDLEEITQRIKAELKCNHADFEYLNEFDGDGGYVFQRVQCKECGMRNTIGFDQPLKPTLWTEQGTEKKFDECMHQFYSEKHYRRIKDFVVCVANCDHCHKQTAHVHPLETPMPEEDGWN